MYACVYAYEMCICMYMYMRKITNKRKSHISKVKPNYVRQHHCKSKKNLKEIDFLTSGNPHGPSANQGLRRRIINTFGPLPDLKQTPFFYV